MTRLAPYAVITVLSLLATPVVVQAMATQKGVATASSTVALAAPVCARPIKVVYAGYGEAVNACAVPVR